MPTVYYRHASDDPAAYTPAMIDRIRKGLAKLPLEAAAALAHMQFTPQEGSDAARLQAAIHVPIIHGAE